MKQVLTIGDAAELFGVSSQTVRSWMTRYNAPYDRAPNGEIVFDLQTLVQWRLGLTDDEFTAEKTRLVRARATSQELKNEVLRGKMVDIESVNLTLSTLFSVIRQRLLAIPAKAASNMALFGSQRALYDFLQAEICFALEELSGHGDFDSADAPSAAPALDDQSVGGPTPEAESGKRRRTRKMAH